MNESAPSQVETVQTKYRVRRSVKATYKRHPEPGLHVVLYVVPRQLMYLQGIKRKATTELGSNVAEQLII